MLEMQSPPPANLTVDGIAVNVPSVPAAVNSIVSAAQGGDNFSVCTLNLDHVVQLQYLPDFRAAYRRARFVTADGFPIVILGRLLGIPIERTTGADLIEPVCREADKKHLPVFLLGSNERMLANSARRLWDRFKGLRIAGCFAPGPNFEPYSRGSRPCSRKHSRLRRQTLLRRPRRAAPGDLCSALSRRIRWNRPALRRRRARVRCWHAIPRALHYAESRTRMGMANAARAAAGSRRDTHAAWPRSAARGAHHSADCQRTEEESGMTSTLTLSLRARNASRTQRRYQICLIHPFDPRGEKVGGLETYIRDFITFHPDGYRSAVHWRRFERRPDARQHSQAHLPWPRLRFPSYPALPRPTCARGRAQHSQLADRAVLHGDDAPFRPDREAGPRQTMLDRLAAG